MANNLIARIGKFLSGINIPYMVIGGQAVLIYGKPRLTGDIDITLGVNINRLNDIIGICKELNLRILADNYQDFVNKTMVLPLADDGSGLRVDLIFSFTDYETTAITRAVDIQIDDTKVKFASLEDIIIHKIFAGRPVDLEDVKNILKINPNHDKNYIKDWLQKLDEGTDNILLIRFNDCNT